MYNQLCSLRPDLRFDIDGSNLNTLKVLLVDDVRYGFFKGCKPIITLDDEDLTLLQEEDRVSVFAEKSVMVVESYFDGLKSCLIHIAMRQCWIDLLEPWISKYPQKLANFAVKYNHLILLKYLVDDIQTVNLMDLLQDSPGCDNSFRSKYSTSPRLWPFVAKEALDKGHGTLDLYRYLRSKGVLNESQRSIYEWTEDRIYTLIIYNQLDLLRYLHEHVIPHKKMSSFLTRYYPTKTNNFELYEWVYNTFPQTQTSKLFLVVDNVKTARLLVTRFPDNVTEKTLIASSRNADIDSFSILWNHHESRHSMISTELPQEDSMSALLRLSKEQPMNAKIFRLFHEYGNPDCSLPNHGARYPDAGFESDNFLKTFYEVCGKREQIMSETFDLRYFAGFRIDVIKYLHSIGSRAFNVKTIEYACMNGNLEVVKFLNENRTEGCTGNAMTVAVHQGYSDCVKYLHEKMGLAPSTYDVVVAAHAGYFEIVKYVKENVKGVLFPPAVMDAAASCGSLRIVKYLHENGKVECTMQALFACISKWKDSKVGARKEVMKFLLQHYWGVFDMVRIYRSLEAWEPWVKEYLEENREKFFVRFGFEVELANEVF
ncbi:hypothetical protein HDU76_003397 [Blyttiomyces sp. JEL0837]|nr:hypothetical protein HDU76_003397 [Blyttiomyces sp. JEL0837]